MITAADQEKPPFRVVLGNTACNSILRALERRLAVVKGHCEVAFSADHDSEETVVLQDLGGRA